MTQTIPSAPMDPLGEALHSLHLSGTFYCRSELTAPWGVTLPPMPGSLMFHVVTEGPCWLEVEGAERQLIKPGSLALVPHGEGHTLLSEPGTPAEGLFDLPRELISERYEILQHGGGGEHTSLICGAVEFDHPAAQHLVKMLPGFIAVEGEWTSPHGEWLQSSLRLIASEAKELRPGGETVITRLADILVIQAIRSWIAEDPKAQTGWLGALKDEQIGRAIALIHRDPSHPWSVASLADEVAMSRSAFASRFTDMVGEPVMHYVARWRMHVALSVLKEDDSPLSAIASRFGYQSEAAFSRAFKRVIGMSPGAARKKG